MSRHKEPTTLVVLESDFEFRDLIRSVIWGSSSEYVLRFASSTSEAAALMEGRDPGRTILVSSQTARSSLARLGLGTRH
jgi:hypothetical protein